MTDGSTTPLGTYVLGGIIALMTFSLPIAAIIYDSHLTNRENIVKINKPVINLNL